MLKRLIAEQGWPVYDLARASGISANSIYRWMDDEVVPHIGNATAIARVLRAPELLDHWGYDGAGNALSEELAEAKTTHDIDVANGWRLDTLISELRETNKILNRIEQHLAPKRPMPEESNE